jgi:hypothetical protein
MTFQLDKGPNSPNLSTKESNSYFDKERERGRKKCLDRERKTKGEIRIVKEKWQRSRDSRTTSRLVVIIDQKMSLNKKWT